MIQIRLTIIEQPDGVCMVLMRAAAAPGTFTKHEQETMNRYAKGIGEIQEQQLRELADAGHSEAIIVDTSRTDFKGDRG